MEQRPLNKGCMSDSVTSTQKHPIRDFVRTMREQFGECEFRAVSADGVVVQSPGWKDEPPMREFPAVTVRFTK